MARSVEAIGVERCLRSTDHGQPINASPPDTFAEFIDGLSEQGFTDELASMARELPRTLLADPH